VKLCKFPAVYREIPATSEEARKKSVIHWNNGYWLVGEDALLEPRIAGEIWHTEDLVRFYPLFVLAVEARHDVRPQAVLLPLTDWITSNRGMQTYVSDLERLTETRVLPQGLMGLHHARKTGLLPDRVLVVDAGFRTVNLAAVHGDDVLKAKTRHDEVGVRNLIQHDFREALKARFPDITFNLVALNRAWQAGYIDTGLRRDSVEIEKSAALRLFLGRFMDLLRRDIAEMAVETDAILFIGGLAYYFRKDMIETNKEVLVPQEKAEFYNVCGAAGYAGVGCAMDLGFGDVKVCVT
jgi:hypothetical protein